MTTKKGNDDDDTFSFDPLEALADIVTGDAFTFFDEPVKAAEKVINDTDTGTGGKAASASGHGGSNGEDGKPEPVKPVPTIKPLPAPTKKGEAAGKQESAEGGDADGGGKKGDGSGGIAPAS